MPCNTPPPPELFEDDVIENAPDDLFEIVYDEDVDNIPEMELGDAIDHSVVTFKGHNDAVICCNFNNSGTLAVSGGQDDKAFVWDVNTGETKFECTGHTDTIYAVEFNHDSTMVATGGLDGKVQVWNVETGEKMWNYDTSELTWLKWHPSENLLFAGTADGNCWKWSIPDEETCGLFPSHGASSSCAQLFANATRCAVGYNDGSVKVWDTNSCQVVASVRANDAHTNNVVSMACSSDGNLICTGSEDGTAKLIRASNCKVLHTWKFEAYAEEEEEEDEIVRESVESVGFFTSHPLVAAGTNQGNLRIFDISTYTQRALVNIGNSIVKLICGATTPLVYIATTPFIELYDGRTAQLQKRWVGHTDQILDIALFRDQEKILTASDDHTCKIFRNS